MLFPRKTKHTPVAGKTQSRRGRRTLKAPESCSMEKRYVEGAGLSPYARQRAIWALYPEGNITAVANSRTPLQPPSPRPRTS
jgi:hypothetical protein